MVGAIYDASLDPAQWQNALRQIAQRCGATHALLYTPMHGPHEGGFVFPYNLSEAAIELWASKSRHEDPFIAAANRRGVFQYGEGDAIDGTSLVPQAELLATPFYRELWAPIGIARVLSGVVFDGADAHKLPTVLAVYRNLSDPPFGAEELELMRRIVAHLSRGLGMVFHLRDAALQVASSRAALDRLGAGVLLLSAKQEVLFANIAAQRSLDAGTPLALVPSVHGGSRLSLPAALQHLEGGFTDLLAGATISDELSETSHFSQALVLEDAQGRPACVLHASPLPSGAALGAGLLDLQAILFVYDLAPIGSLVPRKLCELFSLTPGEARAALQVLEGGGATAMAARLQVSVNTFKSQIKAVYAKTRTQRLPDLLKLLLALSAS